MLRRFIFTALLVIISTSGVFAQTRKGPKPAPQSSAAAAATNLKITYKMTTSGQTMESSTLLRGKRERSETRNGYMDSVSITQCDLKRTIQINNKSQKYLISPMETGSSTTATATTASRPTSSPTTRGGLVTYTTSATDTGERKEMFGFTARHVKSSLKIESSPDACSPVQQRMETDGWYIDLAYGLECEVTHVQSPNYAAPGGCQDRTQFKRLGAARTGYALMETTTMYGPNGEVIFSSSKEIVELSREPLDAALFEIPAGYTEARDTQELYAMPSMTSMMGSAAGAQSQAESSYNQASNSQAKAAGVIRVGVVTINNRAGKPVSIDSLRGRLVDGIETSGVEAVPLNAISQAEAEIEAKAKQCDFILYTDISGLKTSAAKKIGGMFGSVVGAGGIAKTEAKVDFKLFAAGESAPRLQSSSTAKEEGDEESAGVAIDAEAKQVSTAVRKRS